MTKDAFKTRGMALEEEFYRRANARLLQELREAADHEQDVAALKRVSRIQDTNVLEEMLAVGVSAETLRALTLVPTVHVAWANGYIERAEREAIFRAAEGVGIAPASATGQLVGSWLEHPPEPMLMQAWRDYVAALKDVLESATYRQLCEETVDAARGVARSAGGFLGIHAVSVAEERALLEIREAFD